MGFFVLPSDVEELKEELFRDVTALDHDVTRCASLASDVRAAWLGFVASFLRYYKAEESYWTAGTEYDTGVAYQKQLAAWQQRIAASCATSEPTITPRGDGLPSAPEWKSIAASVGVVAGAVAVVYVAKLGVELLEVLRPGRASR